MKDLAQLNRTTSKVAAPSRRINTAATTATTMGAVGAASASVGVDLDENAVSALECSAENDSVDFQSLLGYSYRIDLASVESFVDHLVDNIGKTYAKSKVQAEDSAAVGGSDVFVCAICKGVLYEPVTIPCGHTYCRKCLLTDRVRKCRRCESRFPCGGFSDVKMSVVVGNLLEKLCAQRTKAARLRDEANDLFERREWHEALATYARSNDVYPDDHILQSYQSQAALQLGYSEKALEYAQRTVQLKPSWSEGYYRMGVVLQSIGNCEDAVVAYLQSLVLDSHADHVRSELSQLLYKILNTGFSHQISLENRCSPYTIPFRTSRSNPNSLFYNVDDNLMDDKKAYKKFRKRRMVLSSCSVSSENINFLQTQPLRRLIDQCIIAIARLRKLSNCSDYIAVDYNLIDKSDFDCTLCYRLFWQPVTTPCGHVFCRMCLDRCLDHNPLCPLCKTSLQDYLAERRQSITEFIEVVMKQYLPKEYDERQRLHEDEMSELASVGTDTQHELPIFVCTMAFPTVPCPLHVFEPRYRLLIRQSIESGSKQFGMCPNFDESENGFAEYGTMVEIREAQYFPDGRAIVDTIGKRRFRVVRKGMRDGYNTAAIEFLTDIPIEEAEVNELKTLHDAVHQAVFNWFNHLQDTVQQQILEHFGTMPPLESDWVELIDGPSWCWWVLAILPLDKRAQLSILAMTSLKRRLEAIQRVLCYLQNRRIF